ncbi:hypothetical protein MRX96_001187 [Rhipicephalus microplus]
MGPHRMPQSPVATVSSRFCVALRRGCVVKLNGRGSRFVENGIRFSFCQEFSSKQRGFGPQPIVKPCCGHDPNFSQWTAWTRVYEARRPYPKNKELTILAQILSVSAPKSSGTPGPENISLLRYRPSHNTGGRLGVLDEHLFPSGVSPFPV